MAVHPMIRSREQRTCLHCRHLFISGYRDLCEVYNETVYMPVQAARDCLSYDPEPSDG